MQTTTDDTIQPGPIDPHRLAAHRYQCHHIFPDGTRCGSPALRNETHCYYHHETRKPVANPRDRNARMNTFELPFPDSRTAVQSALGDLMVRIASNDIDPRRAGLLLYCLQLAQANLKASELAVAHEAQQHEAEQREVRQTTEGAPGFSPVHDAPGLSNEVQTEVSCLEDFAQKTGEGESTTSSQDQVSGPASAEAPSQGPEKCTPISRSTFAGLLESLARHQGINVDDPIYTNHNEDSHILAALRAEAENGAIDDPKPTPYSLPPTPSPLVILNHSNAKQTNCPHHPRRLGFPCRDPRKRHRTGPQAHLRQASGDVPQHPHPRQ